MGYTTQIPAGPKQRGPEKWRQLKDCLSTDAVLTGQLTQLISHARAVQTVRARGDVELVFSEKIANLKEVGAELDRIGVAYTDLWLDLDERAEHLDIPDVLTGWTSTHEADPMSLVSSDVLMYNWRYMKEHGVHAVHKKIATYLERLLAITARWHGDWHRELQTGRVDYYAALECELASITALMNCTACCTGIITLLIREPPRD